ncbi:MAG: hypothetical protein HYW02_04495 [Deltaproteobacteria bacterium]|nr:hypothetical protein [Deltaproteobacteria bacterium]
MIDLYGFEGGPIRLPGERFGLFKGVDPAAQQAAQRQMEDRLRQEGRNEMAAEAADQWIKQGTGLRFQQDVLDGADNLEEAAKKAGLDTFEVQNPNWRNWNFSIDLPGSRNDDDNNAFLARLKQAVTSSAASSSDPNGEKFWDRHYGSAVGMRRWTASVSGTGLTRKRG